jgi:hypothetical protein
VKCLVVRSYWLVKELGRLITVSACKKVIDEILV